MNKKQSSLLVAVAVSLIAAILGYTVIADNITIFKSLPKGTIAAFRLLIAMGCFCAPYGVWYMMYGKPNKFRDGEEHGSSKWASVKEMQNFKDPRSEENNFIFSENSGLALSREKFSIQYDRNLNVCVTGGSGSGKTRYYVKPNLMQLNANYFVTDPKGTLLLETGHLFEDKGYEIKVFNTIDFASSMYYNPLQYVKTDAEILSFVKCLIKNTSGKKNDTGDPFWENSETLLYVSLIAFMRDWMSDRDYTLPSLLKLLAQAEAHEDDESFKSPLDLLFDQIETGKKYVQVDKAKQQNEKYSEVSRDVVRHTTNSKWEWQPSKYVRRDGVRPADKDGLDASEDFALSNYKAFKTAAGKTLKSIIISCNVRLKPIEIKEISTILGGMPDENGKPTGKCELELDKLGDKDKKCVLFGILSDTNRTFAFLTAILMWQTIDILCNVAYMKYGGKLPRLFMCIFDEFANIGTMPDIDQTIAITRSRNISLSIILQNFAQLEERYSKEAARIIRGNCDSQVLLGGTDLDTNKEISETLGKETIDSVNISNSFGQSSSSSDSYQKLGRELLNASEIGLMDRRDCIVLIKGTYPFKNRKYDIERHKNYKYIDPHHGGKNPAIYDDDFMYKPYLSALRDRKRKEMK